MLRGTPGDTWSSCVCLLSKCPLTLPFILTSSISLDWATYLGLVGNQAVLNEPGRNSGLDEMKKMMGSRWVALYSQILYIFSFFPCAVLCMDWSLSAFCLIDTKMKAATRYKIENLVFAPHLTWRCLLPMLWRSQGQQKYGRLSYHVQTLIFILFISGLCACEVLSS